MRNDCAIVSLRGPMTTLRDIARRAGVSVSTVSHVLNGTRFVSEVRRQRVLAAIQELGYEPNAVARSLKINRSHTIGLIISDINNPFFTAVVRGVEDVANQHGYSVILCNTDENPDKELNYLRILRSKRVDGLIIAPTGVLHEYLRNLVHSNFPIVFIDRELDNLPVSAVVLDNETAAYQIVKHLISLGHRRIGLISGRPRISTTTLRISGYRRALTEAGLPVDERLIVSGYSRIEGGVAATHALLECTPPPTALFAANNLMTIGALIALAQRCLRVPDDVALVGFDDFPWADVLRPRLTTVAQPTYDLGREAAQLLMQRLKGDPNSYRKRIVLSGQLMVRESCGSSRLSRMEVVSDKT